MRITFADGAFDHLTAAQWGQSLSELGAAVREGDIPVEANYRGMRLVLEPPKAARVNLPARSRELRQLLRVLVLANVEWLRQHPQAPHLYKSGARYVREAPGSEEWQGIEQLYARKGGDCEDLSAALCAWNVLKQGQCTIRVLWRTFDEEDEDGHTSWHIQVRRRDGKVEDPSKVLGMEGDA